MTAIIVLGNKPGDREPHLLYCGLDGVEAQRIADEARESGSFSRLHKIVNPMTIPLPAIPFPKAATAAAIPAVAETMVPKFKHRKISNEIR